ncbi:hypothetical protein OROMI_027849 [Orobanche minor]
MASEVDSGIIEVGCDYESIRSDQALLSWFPFTEECVATSFQKIPNFSWEEYESDSFIPKMEFPVDGGEKKRYSAIQRQVTVCRQTLKFDAASLIFP